MKKGPHRSRRGEIGGPSCSRSIPPRPERVRVGSVSGGTRIRSRSGRAEPGLCERRRPQRPALGCGSNGPPDRRSLTAGTRVGGLPWLRPGVRVPSEISRSGVRSSRWQGASGSARTCAIQPSRGVLDCMAQTEHQTAYRTVKARECPLFYRCASRIHPPCTLIKNRSRGSPRSAHSS
jgi:hypothetical protein